MKVSRLFFVCIVYTSFEQVVILMWSFVFEVRAPKCSCCCCWAQTTRDHHKKHNKKQYVFWAYFILGTLKWIMEELESGWVVVQEARKWIKLFEVPGTNGVIALNNYNNDIKIRPVHQLYYVCMLIFSSKKIKSNQTFLSLLFCWLNCCFLTPLVFDHPHQQPSPNETTSGFPWEAQVQYYYLLRWCLKAVELLR